MGLQRGLVGGNQARMGPWQAPAAPIDQPVAAMGEKNPHGHWVKFEWEVSVL